MTKSRAVARLALSVLLATLLLAGCGAPAPTLAPPATTATPVPATSVPTFTPTAQATALEPTPRPSAPPTPAASATRAASPAATPRPTRVPPTSTPTPRPTPDLSQPARTYFVDGQKGSDDADGSAAAPWRTMEHAFNTILSGDTVVIADGVYRVSNLRFRPEGVNTGRRTVFKAAPGARVIFSTVDDLPPAIYVTDYVRLEGLWFGGRWKAVETLFNVGGNPIGRGKQLVNCTIFGYDGISQGSAEYYLYQGNRFVRNGRGRFQHPLYLSGGYNAGELAQHAIVDNNIFAVGEGYAIHGWHKTHSNIVTRNFVAGHYWGLVLDGSDHLVANNFFWKMTGQAGHEPGWGPWLPGERIFFSANILGPAGNVNIPADGPHARRVQDNAFLGVKGQGANPLLLKTSTEWDGALGIGEAEIDETLAALDRAFAQSVAALHADRSIEPLFATLRATIPPGSPLHGVGAAWYQPDLAVNYGPDAPAPDGEDAFWSAFRALGLKDFDRFGRSAP